MKLYAIWKLISSIRVKTKIIIIPSSEGQTRCIALHSTEVHSFTFTTSLNGFRLVYKMLPPLMPEWSFDVPKGSPQIWQVTSLTSNKEGHPLSQPIRVDASLTLTLLRYSELKWYGNLNVEYKFNVDSLDTEGVSGDAVRLLLGSCWDELGASSDVVGMLEVIPGVNVEKDVPWAGDVDAEAGSESPCVNSSSEQKRTWRWTQRARDLSCFAFETKPLQLHLWNAVPAFLVFSTLIWQNPRVLVALGGP